MLFLDGVGCPLAQGQRCRVLLLDDARCLLAEGQRCRMLFLDEVRYWEAHVSGGNAVVSIYVRARALAQVVSASSNSTRVERLD